MRLACLPKKLWEHKKKAAFGFTVAYFISRKIQRWKRFVFWQKERHMFTYSNQIPSGQIF